MSTSSINVLGYTGSNSSFVVKTVSTSLQIADPKDKTANPFEFLLAGFAGYLNSIGHLAAAAQGIALNSLQVEIKGSLSTAGFETVKVLLMPTSAAPLPALQRWLKQVQEQSSVYSCLASSPMDFVLYKEYTHS